MKRIRSKVTQNILANFAGNVWVGLITIAGIPWLIQLVGLEGYGLIGVYLVLSNISVLFNAGLSNTLNCELARLSGTGENRRVNEMFRSLEVVCWGMVALATVVLLSASPLISLYWLNARATAQHELLTSIVAMTLAITLAIPFRLYLGGLLGLQRQVTSSILLAAVSTLRLLGGILIVMSFGGGAATFFYWQILISLVAVAGGRWQLKRHLPAARDGEGFSFQMLGSLKGLVAGMSGVSIAGIAFSQLDKVVLSKILTLAEFGQYSVAASLASSVVWFVNPISSALFPRFTELAAGKGRHSVLVDVFHSGSQLVALLVLPACMTGVFFAKDVLQLWAGDTVANETVCNVLVILVLGSALNALLHVPHVLQLAHGWTSLTIGSLVLAIVAMIPLTVVMAMNFGPVGGATSWFVANLALLLITPHFMHARLLNSEKYRWYWQSVVCPFAIATLCAALGRYLTPQPTSGATVVAAVAATLVATWIGVGAALPIARVRFVTAVKTRISGAPNVGPPSGPTIQKIRAEN
ncbi:MAG: hypothetical protein WD049_05730 [Candidatus Paceibacterota bacterium]